MLTDIRPLRVSAPYRRLFFGNAIGQLGQQMTVVTIAVQVFTLTDSSFAVGVIGILGLVPLIGFGLYAGAIADAMDRRLLALVASAGSWMVSLVLAAQAFLGNTNVLVIYACVVVQSACYAATSPARGAMIARLLPADLLPAASALNSASFNLGFTVGPMLGALLISVGGFEVAYTVDALLFTATLYAIARVPAMPPSRDSPRAGFRSVLDGLDFLRRSPNLRMTFVLDLCAMVFANPRAVFPALGYKVFGGGAATVGILQAAPAVGALAAFAVSGWISRVRWHGVAIVVSIVVYGAAIGSVGLVGSLWLGVVFLCLAGAADSVSSAFRNTVLQVAAPDELRGRLQGVFVVVVAGGPRAGDFLVGSVGEATYERLALVLGGLACIVGVLIAVVLQRSFLRYDARHPAP